MGKEVFYPGALSFIKRKNALFLNMMYIQLLPKKGFFLAFAILFKTKKLVFLPGGVFSFIFFYIYIFLLRGVGGGSGGGPG